MRQRPDQTHQKSHEGTGGVLVDPLTYAQKVDRLVGKDQHGRAGNVADQHAAWDKLHQVRHPEQRAEGRDQTDHEDQQGNELGRTPGESRIDGEKAEQHERRRIRRPHDGVARCRKKRRHQGGHGSTKHSVNDWKPGDGSKGDRLGNRQQCDIRCCTGVSPEFLEAVIPERSGEWQEGDVFRGIMVPDTPSHPDELAKIDHRRRRVTWIGPCGRNTIPTIRRRCSEPTTWR